MWTYLKFDSAGDPLPSSPKLPGPKSAYLAFDALRMEIVIGYTERNGMSSFLYPNASDDCRVVAWAPLSETAAPERDKMQKNCPNFDFSEDVEPTYPYAVDRLPILVR